MIGYDKIVLLLRVLSFGVYFFLSFMLSGYIFPLFGIDSLLGIALIFLMIIGLSALTAKPLDNLLKAILNRRIYDYYMSLDDKHLKGIRQYTLKKYETAKHPILKNRMLYLAFYFHYEEMFVEFPYLKEIQQLVDETDFFEKHVNQFYDSMSTEALLNQDVAGSKMYTEKWLNYVDGLVDNGKLEEDKLEQEMLYLSTVLRDYMRLYDFPNVNNAGKLLKKNELPKTALQARLYKIAVIMLDNGLIEEGKEYLRLATEMGGNNKVLRAIEFIKDNKRYFE